VVASLNKEVPFYLWESARLDILDMCAKTSDRNGVFCFAGDGACVASNTGFLVDHEPVLHADSLLKQLQTQEPLSVRRHVAIPLGYAHGRPR